MRLNVHFDPDMRPESQHQLRLIPASTRVNQPEIKAALVAYEKAREAEHEARLAHVQAEQELPAAEFKDEQALADAQAVAGKKDPGPVHADKQRALIRDLKRKHGAARITLQRTVATIGDVFDEHGDAHEAQLQQQGDELRGRIASHLDGFSSAWTELQQNRAALAVGSHSGHLPPSMYAASIPAPRAQDGGVIAVSEVVELLRKLGEPREPRTDVVENVPLGQPQRSHKERVIEWKKRENDRAEAEAKSLAAYGGTLRDEHVDAASQVDEKTKERDRETRKTQKGATHTREIVGAGRR
jgi:hypothetical protein